MNKHNNIDPIKLTQGIFGKILITMSMLLLLIIVIFTSIQIQSEKYILISKVHESISEMKLNLKREGRSVSSGLGRITENAIASYDFFGLFEVIRESVDLEPNLSYAILVNKDRKALLHTDRPDLEQEVLDQNYDIFASQQERPIFQEYESYESDKTKYLEYIFPIQVSTSTWGHLRLGFSLIALERKIEHSENEIKKQTRHIVLRSLVLAGIFMILGTFVAFILSRKISHPISVLTAYSAELAQGNYSFKPDEELIGKDEVGRLASSFGIMAANIKHANDKLEGYSQNLEEKVKERTNELESVNQELKNFAYIVSHDLKAPLRSIGSLASWLKTDYENILDDAGKEQLELLVGRVNRMHALIGGILQYSRVGRVDEVTSKVDINFMIQEVIDILNPPENIKIILDSDFPIIDFEPTRIQQIFQNIISNAIKYIDKPEGIIHLGCKSHGEFWEFYVSDNGPGIDEKYHDKVFQLFQTLQSKDTYESTGVGLSIIKKIIETNNGRIWIESSEGSGTTFKFLLLKEKCNVKK
ncbi:HAMP domain-containing protein [bacterium]|jgi:signal transduction histidine kinase|nr:HAMP domain-containing protein [bacterium]